MGLAEKRAIEEFKTTGFTKFTDELKTITKFDVPVEVKWDELSSRIEASSDKKEAFNEYFDAMFAQTLLQSFKSVCADNMGREALHGALKKIVLVSGPEASYWASGFKFEGGTLTLNMSYANVSDVKDRVKGMTELLESKL